jgi:histidinol phosphatase-like enzyme (inositol monophosphatase family)
LLSPEYPDFSEIHPFLFQLAEEASTRALEYFHSNIEVESKEDKTPVTVADRDIENKIRENIIMRFPSHGIRGEEFPDHNIQAAIQWIIDPIDGTRSFISGIPFFSTLIGLLYNDNPVFGCLAIPCEKKIYTSNGKQIYLNNKLYQRTAEKKTLENSLLITTDERDIYRLHPSLKYRKLTEQASFVRTWGDGYGYAMILENRAQLMLDPELNPWDILPLIPLLKAAGLATSALNGKDPVTEANMLCGEKDLHHRALKILNSEE